LADLERKLARMEEALKDIKGLSSESADVREELKGKKGRESGSADPREEMITRIAQQVTELVRNELLKSFRFANMNEVPAATIVLQECGHPMRVDAIVKELMAGGIWREATGAKGSSAAAEMRRSLSQAARHGVNLSYASNKDEDLIGLSSWKPKGA
jgi:hypothetical protein